jgi:hypothetical protein
MQGQQRGAQERRRRRDEGTGGRAKAKEVARTAGGKAAGATVGRRAIGGRSGRRHAMEDGCM